MKIIHFADLHLGVESYGHIDPATGLYSRFLDFIASFDQLVDYALENRIDLVLFCGDAYKSRDPSQTQQREFASRIKKLSEGGVTVFLLVGNHDLPNAVGRATTPEIFNILSVQNVHVANRPGIHDIKTRRGIIQIAALPWLRRSFLLTREDTKNLNFDELNKKMQQKLSFIIENLAKKLNPAIPSILAAHVWVSGASVGSEEAMTIGQEHVLLPGTIANPVFDYIALGHIHRHQVLSKNPPLVYAGSLERLDFGDENDDKGFYLVDISTDKKTAERRVVYNFRPVDSRRFLTISTTIEPQDIEPMATIRGEISHHDITDAIVRLKIDLSQESEGQILDTEIRNALKDAHSYTITKDIKRQNRLRLGGHSAQEITPLVALKAYINDRKFSKSYSKLLLKYGEELIKEKASAD
ncbi:MAG: exonuclease subunit SbcD [Dehalococcoidia bacterium]|nr:MAG: exonuclease subunit SbcD [Dehalococcoidia bacterium]